MLQRAPLGRKIPYDPNKWFSQYKKLAKRERNHALLESGRGGQFSIIGLHPFARIKGKNDILTIEIDGKTEQLCGDPLLMMKEWMKNYRTDVIPEYPDFQGGAIGYISYDYVRNIEKLPSVAKDDLSLPDLYFMLFDDVFVYDHQDCSLWIITHYMNGEIEKAESRLSQLIKKWTEVLNDDDNAPFSPSSDKESVSLNEDEFINATEKIKDYISQGDIFQVNLSVRQSKPLKNNPFHIYEKLRQVNPSPYMAYIYTPEFQIVSGSPELLVKKKGDVLNTRPIAGTRSRGASYEEDIALANELINNEKERAEHVMLVDLERNDLGKVCKYGTVEVNEFMVIERYSHVMHIVSNVRGKISDNCDVFDVIRATFPGGTITGAPKVRTMEIIEELEPVRRGIYTGSIGWISFSGEMELNIAIRTMVAKNGIAHIQAGAGIVIDSNPKYEYKESLKKAKALWKAKELSEAEIVK